MMFPFFLHMVLPLTWSHKNSGIIHRIELCYIQCFLLKSLSISFSSSTMGQRRIPCLARKFFVPSVCSVSYPIAMGSRQHSFEYLNFECHFKFSNIWFEKIIIDHKLGWDGLNTVTCIHWKVKNYPKRDLSTGEPK